MPDVGLTNCGSLKRNNPPLKSSTIRLFCQSEYCNQEDATVQDSRWDLVNDQSLQKIRIKNCLVVSPSFWTTLHKVSGEDHSHPDILLKTSEGLLGFHFVCIQAATREKLQSAAPLSGSAAKAAHRGKIFAKQWRSLFQFGWRQRWTS